MSENSPNELRISVEELRKTKLFVATPMYGGNCVGLYMKACLELQTLCFQHGVEVRFSLLFNESLITRARNYLVDEFLRSGFTHLLFIDSDILFNPQDVLALIALNRDVVGAPYPKKSINWRAVWAASKRLLTHKDFDESKFNPKELEGVTGEYVFNPVPGTTQFKTTEPLEVLELGTGYMMVKRAVFDKFREEYPHLSYKPDHHGQPNFDGSRYIHAYFDTVIDPETHRYLSEDYMFCLEARSKVVTEDGIKTMKEIVDSKYSGKVLSFDSEGNSSWNKVVGWSARKGKKKWVKLNTNTNSTQFKLRCTEDHKVSILENIFKPVIKWVEAKDTSGKYVVRWSDNGNRKYHKENCLYNSDQISALIGTICGDATVTKNGQISFTHSSQQKEYIEHKINLFGGNISNIIQNRGFGENSTCYNAWTPVNAQTKALRQMMYVNGKKTLKNILPLFDEKSLAYLYMDDGSLRTNGAGISVCGFSEDDQKLLLEHLSSKFGIVGKIDHKKVEYKNTIREYPYIRFNKEAAEIMFSLISQYVPESMKYKLPEKFKKSKFVQLNNKRLDYSAAFVVSVDHLNQSLGKLYDIEVENNHNFVANGTLVHNCQYWRNIGGKVWLCPWMKTVHIGTYGFEGDLQKIANLIGNL